MSYTPIKLDKVRNFRYGMRALDRIEKTLDTTLNQLDIESQSMGNIAVIMWAGLVHEDEGLTPDKVMDLVDSYSSMPAAFRVMLGAFRAAFGDFGDAEDGAASEAKND